MYEARSDAFRGARVRGRGVGAAVSNRTVRVIVPWPPGQATELAARLVAQKLSEALGQPFVAENRPGAGRQIGAEAVVKAAPDGYTLLAASSGPISIMPVLQKTPYDPLKDLARVSLIAKGAFALVTAKRSAALPDVPTLAEAADLPDYDAAAWIGFAAPPGTPREMLERVAGEIQKAVAGDGLEGTLHLPRAWTPYRPRLDEMAAFLRERAGPLRRRSSGTRTSRSSSSRNGARRRSSPRSRRS